MHSPFCDAAHASSCCLMPWLTLLAAAVECAAGQRAAARPGSHGAPGGLRLVLRRVRRRLVWADGLRHARVHRARGDNRVVVQGYLAVAAASRCIAVLQIPALQATSPTTKPAATCDHGSQCALCAQVLARCMRSAQSADVWAAGCCLWALVGGGFPFLCAEEEALDRPGRMGVMAPRILAGAFRPLPPEVRTRVCVDLAPITMPRKLSSLL